MQWIDPLIDFLKENYIPISMTIGLVIIYAAVRALIGRLILNHSRKHKIAYGRSLYIKKLTNGIITLLVFIVLGVAWEISIEGLSLYFASIFTVIGVALFATWSILSNLTASILLFFFFPYRIGSQVKIIDGDNSVEGKIVDITFFYMKIKTADKMIVTYPNNLAMQKPILCPE